MAQEPTPTASHEARVDTRRVATQIIGAVIVFEILLLGLDYVFNFFDVVGSLQIRRIFNIARESSLPTWFSSLQAVGVAATAAGMVWVERQRGASRAVWGWGFVAGFFLYVGIDDAAEVHERLGTAFSDAMPEASSFFTQFPSFSWHLFVAPVLGAALLATAVLLWRLVPGRQVRRLVLLGLSCFLIAQGLDFLEGIDGLFDGWASSLDVEDYTVAHGFRAVEETLEMLGTTSFWAIILFQLVEQTAGLRITLDPDDERS